MKKNKTRKENLPVVIATILIIALVIVLIFIIPRDKHSKAKPTNVNYGEVANLKDYKGNVPDFTLEITGTYKGTVTNETLKQLEVPIYEFDANINNGWDLEINHYRGIKLKDLLERMGFTEYASIKFNAHQHKTVEYNKDVIDDKLYLIFYTDRKASQTDHTLSLLSIDKLYEYSVEELANMVFSNPVENPPAKDSNE